MRTRLAERQVAAEHRQARRAEGIRQRNQQRSVAVRSCAVRKYESVPVRIVWTMQEPANRYALRRSLPELLKVIHTTQLSRQPIQDSRPLFRFGNLAVGHPPPPSICYPFIPWGLAYRLMLRFSFENTYSYILGNTRVTGERFPVLGFAVGQKVGKARRFRPGLLDLLIPL